MRDISKAARRPTQRNLRRRMKKAGLGVAGAMAVMGAAAGGAAAQCVDSTGGAGFLVPFASGTAISSIVTTVGAVNNSSLAQSTAFVGSPSGPQPDQQGGGIWVRGIGGEVETKANSSTSIPSLEGSVNCRTTTKQTFTGVQLGMDIGRYNIGGGGGNMYWGITGGYFEASAKDKTPGQGSFSGDWQIPFGGIYAGINRGAFAADAQVRFDHVQGLLTDRTEAIFKQELDAKSYSFLWNASYRFDVAKNWFVEPSIGGVWSRTEVDQFNIISESPIFFGTARIHDIDSLLGRASLRVGTTILTPTMAWLPFATVSMFHEFAGAVKTDVGSAFTPSLSSSTTSRVGTYAHAGIGIAGLVLETGWLGYARLDYRGGENIEGISINAGLRYQLQPPKELASLKHGHHDHRAPFNWTGFYVGGLGGGLFGRADYVDEFGETKPRFSGGLLGATAGYNHQFGHWLIGAEADIVGTNAIGGTGCPGDGTIGFKFSCGAEMKYLGIVGGRLGFVQDRALFFAKAGLAVGSVRADNSNNGGNGTFASTDPDVRSDSKVMTGWAVGGGMELAVNERWTAKAEYMHFDLGSSVFDVYVGSPARVQWSGDMARIGLNYHFGNH